MTTPRKRKKDPHAVALGRKGGKRGAAITNAKLTPEQRSANASKAALALAKKMTPEERSERARKARAAGIRKQRKARPSP